MLRFLPAAVAVSIFPFLFGGIPQEAKAIVGLLVGGTFLLISGESSSYQRRFFPQGGLILAAILTLLPVVPLPVDWVRFLSPERVELHRWSTIGDSAPSSWLSLTLSTSRSLERLWQLALGFTCFHIARRAGAAQRTTLLFAWMIVVAIAGLGLADVWYRLHEHQSILGLWNTRWTKGAGTFQNRNVFAGWVTAGSMVGMGLILRYAAPLRGLRGGTDPAPSAEPGLAITAGCLVLTGLVMAFATASRGALLAFATGVGGLLFTLSRKSSNSRRFAGLLVAFLAGTAALLYTSDRLLTRLSYIGADATQAERYGKLRIWEETRGIQQRFPWLGTGLGSFLTSFRLYKTAVPDSVAEHAENDYLETLTETGILGGGVICFVALGCLIRVAKSLRREHIREPEILMGSLAALVTLAAHACFEFVLQNPSCLVLGATAFGLCLGILEAKDAPLIPGPSAAQTRVVRIAWGCAMLTIAAINLASFTSHRAGVIAWESGHREAGRKAIETGLRLWPWIVERQIVWIRAQTEGLRREPQSEWPKLSSAILARARSYQRFDPLDWELRYEMAWLALYFQTDQEPGISEALRACRANPLQHRIPLAFARHFRNERPEVTFQFLKLVPQGAGTRQALDLALETEFEPRWLWEITPSNDAGMWELASSALAHGRTQLAKQAISRLQTPPSPLKLGTFYLKSKAPDEVTRLILEASTSAHERLLLAEAWLSLSNYRKSIELSSSIWRESSIVQPARKEADNKPSESVSPQDSGLMENLDPATASAEAIQRLQEIAAKHPEDRTAAALLFDIAVLKGDLHGAAQVSLRMAKAITRKAD